MRHLNRQRHEFRSLIARIAEHHPLIAGALFFMQAFAFGHTLRNIRRLLLDRGENSAGIAIKPHGRIGVADFTHYLANDIGIAHLGFAGDLSGDHNHASFRQALTGHAAIRIAALDAHREPRRISDRIICRDDLRKPIPM